MNNHTHYHFELYKALHDKMTKIYIYQALLTFAKSLIGIFVPVYLYKLGYSFVEIILYTLGTSLIYLIMIPLSVKIINKIGFKYSLLLSTPIYLLHITFLNYLGESIIFYHLSWISFGLYVSIFWPTFHSELALNGSSKHRSSQMGTLQIISVIFGTLAPLIGGIFLDLGSYWYLLLFSSILVFLGLIPLLLAEDIKLQNYTFDHKDYFKFMKSKKNISSKKAFAFQGVDSILSLHVWPIIVFILLNESFFNLGALFSIIAFINLIFILYTKSYFDKKNKHLFLKKITTIISFNWFLKSIVTFFSTFFLFFVEAISKLAQNLFSMLFMSIFYNNAKKIGYMDYIIFREFYLHTAKLFFGSILIILFILFGQSIQILLGIAFSGIFVSLGLSYLKEEK